MGVVGIESAVPKQSEIQQITLLMYGKSSPLFQYRSRLPKGQKFVSRTKGRLAICYGKKQVKFKIQKMEGSTKKKTKDFEHLLWTVHLVFPKW